MEKIVVHAEKVRIPGFVYCNQNMIARNPSSATRGRHAFTLIELLIVVAIISILAAIAVPNFLEAQTRARVSRVKADLRSIAAAIEAYRLDNNAYPEGTDSAVGHPVEIDAFLGPLAAGYYTFRTRTNDGRPVGPYFAGITTPIAYIATVPTDPFAQKAASFLTYCYRNAKVRKNGWILTSVGPDADLITTKGIGNANTWNPLSTAVDAALSKGRPARLADINENQYTNFIEGTPAAPATAANLPFLSQYLADLSYDPTNGTISDGDLWRTGP